MNGTLSASDGSEEGGASSHEELILSTKINEKL
jgi:hypothetical protein